ncbi:MAG TPA: kynureninase [Acetobacteraceae bacterium]|jgi:kynureninase|nr:kynureninase [Acetobacteraceae bacterium]
MPTSLTRTALQALDRNDTLALFRDEFDLPPDVIYLDGNSLGPLPKATPGRVARVVAHEWGQSLIRAWNAHDWIRLPLRVGEKIGHIIGAEPGSTLVADSTSVNLFKLLAAALEARPTRRIILTEAGNFPTDIYMAQGLAALLRRGHEVRAVADPLAALNDDVAVLMLTHVNYRSGAMHDMATVTSAAHAVGALTLWDLSHSVGAVPLQLAKDGADFAVGCGYKYLNGGPGAPAFLSVAPRLQTDLQLPLTGWLGHANPFAFAPDYRPAQGIGRGMVGTPPILNLAALEVGIDQMLRVPTDALHKKSQQLIDLFITLVEQECAEHGFRLLTPRDATRRGSQVAFAHPDGYAIMQTLIARGVIGDFRTPDVMRFGLAPLYVRHVDVWDALTVLSEVMRTNAWRDPSLSERRAVT